MVVTVKQWVGLTLVFLVVMFFFLFDMLFPRVQIVIFSDTADADMLAVLREVDDDVTIRQGRGEEAADWEVNERPTYLVLGYGHGDRLTFHKSRYAKDWFLLHRSDDVGELIRYLNRDWNLMFWRWWLSD